MSSEKCLCCSVHQAAVAAANYFILAYGAALGVTVWWIIQSQGQVVIGAYVLLAIYFITFMLSIILVLSLAVQKRPSVLFVWMLIICIFFLPECGLNLWVCIWSLGVHTAKGLGFLIFYAVRGLFNIIGIVCVNFAYTAWNAEKKASKKRIAHAYAASAYSFSAPPPAPFYFWNYNPHFPLLNFHQNLPNGQQAEYGTVPYSLASSFHFRGLGENGRPTSPRRRPLAAGLVVKHRVPDGGARKEPADKAEITEIETVQEDTKEQKADQTNERDRKEGSGADHTKELIPEQMPIPGVFMVDPWRLNYPPPPPFWPSSNPPMPQHFDRYTPAPLSASALAFSAPSLPNQNMYPPAIGRVPSYYYSNSRAAPIDFQQPLFTEWRGGITPMRNWNSATGLYELPKNPIPPGTVFDAKGPDVEPSFGNFIMRQRRLGDFRPKALRSLDDTKMISEHIYRPAEHRRVKATPKFAPRTELERPQRAITPVYDRTRNKTRRQQTVERVPPPQPPAEQWKRLHPRPRVISTKHQHVRHQSRDRRKSTLTTLLSSSYYRYQTTTRRRMKGNGESAADSSTTYGHTPVRLDETTWTLM